MEHATYRGIWGRAICIVSSTTPWVRKCFCILTSSLIARWRIISVFIIWLRVIFSYDYKRKPSESYMWHHLSDVIWRGTWYWFGLAVAFIIGSWTSRNILSRAWNPPGIFSIFVIARSWFLIISWKYSAQSSAYESQRVRYECGTSVVTCIMDGFLCISITCLSKAGLLNMCAISGFCSIIWFIWGFNLIICCNNSGLSNKP